MAKKAKVPHMLYRNIHKKTGLHLLDTLFNFEIGRVERLETMNKIHQMIKVAYFEGLKDGPRPTQI